MTEDTGTGYICGYCRKYVAPGTSHSCSRYMCAFCGGVYQSDEIHLCWTNNPPRIPVVDHPLMERVVGALERIASALEKEA